MDRKCKIQITEEFQPPYQVWKPPIGIGTEIQFLDSDREKTWRGIVSGMIPSVIISSHEEPIYSVEEAVSDNGEEAGCFHWIKNNGYKVTGEYKKITSQDDFDKLWWDSMKIICSEKGDDFSFPEDLIDEMELQTDYEIKAQFFDINKHPETEIEKAFHFALEGFNKQFKTYDSFNKTWIFSTLEKNDKYVVTGS